MQNKRVQIVYYRFFHRVAWLLQGSGAKLFKWLAGTSAHTMPKISLHKQYLKGQCAVTHHKSIVHSPRTKCGQQLQAQRLTAEHTVGRGQHEAQDIPTPASAPGSNHISACIVSRQPCRAGQVRRRSRSRRRWTLEVVCCNHEPSSQSCASRSATTCLC